MALDDRFMKYINDIRTTRQDIYDLACGQPTRDELFNQMSALKGKLTCAETYGRRHFCSAKKYIEAVTFSDKRLTKKTKEQAQRNLLRLDGFLIGYETVARATKEVREQVCKRIKKYIAQMSTSTGLETMRNKYHECKGFIEGQKSLQQTIPAEMTTWLETIGNALRSDINEQQQIMVQVLLYKTEGLVEGYIGGQLDGKKPQKEAPTPKKTFTGKAGI